MSDEIRIRGRTPNRGGTRMNRTIPLAMSLVLASCLTLVSCSRDQGASGGGGSSPGSLFVKGESYFVCCGYGAVSDRGQDVTVIEYGPGPWIKVRVNKGQDAGNERWMNSAQVSSMRKK